MTTPFCNPGAFPLEEHEEGGIEGWQDEGVDDLVEKILLEEKQMAI